MFEKVARLMGFLPRKIGLSARYIGPGRLLPVKSELDWQLVHSSFPVAFVDTKTFSGDRFAYSQIDEAQLKLANLFNDWGSPAGFIVWLRATNKVVFYSGRAITRKGEGNSFGSDDGVILGDMPNFRLSGIYSQNLAA